MSELNKLVSDILNSNEHNTKNAIQQLFHLLGSQPQQHHELIQKAILFSMENLHEWANMMKYIDKWQMNSFRRAFIDRMRKRVNEQPPNNESIDTNQEAKRLVEKYWKTRSPKKQENFYKEPIILKNIIRNTLSSTVQITNDKIHTPEAVGTETIPQKQPQVQPKEESKSSNLNRRTQPQGETSNATERRQKGDPLASVTGRPPILKKKSIIQNIPKPNPPSESNHEQEKKFELSKNLPNSRIQNIIKRYADKEQPKSTDSWDNFGNNTKEPPKKDEDFPTDKFKFGSNKKSNEPELTKKIPLSPRKYDPTTKAVKIIRNEPKQPYENVENLHQFSFASSARKQEPPKSHPSEQVVPPKPLPLPQEHQSQSDKFVFHDIKESEQTPQIRNQNQNNSFQKVASPAETPMFMFNESKKRRSSINRHQQALQIDEQLKLYDPNIKLRYFMHQIQVRLKMDTLSLFQEQWSNFVKHPQTSRR